MALTLSGLRERARQRSIDLASYEDGVLDSHDIVRLHGVTPSFLRFCVEELDAWL